MDLRHPNKRGIFLQHRVSPVSRAAILFTAALAAIAFIASIATHLTFAALPDIAPLVLGVLAVDILSQFAPQTRIVAAVQMLLYGVLYLVITSFCGVLAAYATQRFAFPLQDRFFGIADAALGVRWFDFVYWVDRHPTLKVLFEFAYGSMSSQIALPLLVLALAHRAGELRVYLLAYGIALTLTVIIAAFLPGASPIAVIDRSTFQTLRFSGATPLDHLMQLRSGAPMILREFPGGILTFPSFHATVAFMVPLSLRRYRPLFAALLVLNAVMLVGTVTEGAHYVVDIPAGAAVAFFACWLARRIIRIEDCSLQPGASPARPHAQAGLSARAG